MKADVVFTLPDPPSRMRTENWESESFIHTEAISLKCSCGEDHEDHMAAAQFSIRVLTKREER